MELTYQIVLGLDGQESNVVLCHQKGFIPKSEGNTDYQAYLKWLEEGNAPLGADTPEPASDSVDNNTNQGN